MKTNKKNLILTLILAILNCNFLLAQLKVINSGNVGIKTLTPIADLHVVGNSIFTSTTGWPAAGGCVFIRGNNGYSTQTTPDYTWFNNDQTGLFHPANNVIAFSIGGVEKMRIDANGNVGIGIAPNSSYKLTISGSAYAPVGIWQGSDKRYKRNISSIDGALNKILKLNGVSYEFRKDEFKELNFSEGKNLGFIAQELKEVLPEAVRLEANGFYSVNYVEIIPVLVEAIKEQNKKIDNLETQISYCCTNKQQTNSNNIGTGNSLPQSGTVAQLSQNKPNPFNQQTNIGYYLPTGTQSASVMIFDMQGKLIKTIAVTSFGNGSLAINANELSPGIFIYSLVADGREVDSKRMIITQ